MGHYLIVTWDGAGNLAPTLGITRALIDRGHDPRLLGHESIAAPLRRWRRRGGCRDVAESLSSSRSTIWTDPDPRRKGETIDVARRRVGYRIVLDPKNAKAFGKFLDTDITHATRIGGRRHRRTTTPSDRPRRRFGRYPRHPGEVGKSARAVVVVGAIVAVGVHLGEVLVGVVGHFGSDAAVPAPSLSTPGSPGGSRVIMGVPGENPERKHPRP
jgi:hypothetical protein